METSSTSCKSNATWDPDDFSAQKDAIHATLDHIFDTPKNGLQHAFKLVVSLLSAQQEQYLELRKDYLALKADSVTWFETQEEKLHTQLMQNQHLLETQVKGLREEVQFHPADANHKIDTELTLNQIRHDLASLQESCKVNNSCVFEMNQSRITQLEEKTEALSIELGILHESLLGGTMGAADSKNECYIPVPIKPREKKKEMNVNEWKTDDGPCYQTSHDSRIQNIQLYEPHSLLSSTVVGFIDNVDSSVSPVEISEKDDVPIHGSNTSHEALSPNRQGEISLDTSYHPSSVGSLIVNPLLPQLNNESSSSSSTSETSGKSTMDEEASLVDDSSQTSINSYTILQKLDNTASSHDEQRRETIRSSALKVINTLYESVQLKRHSLPISSGTRSSSTTNGVIIHLLDQEKIIEKEFKSLSNRIDSLAEALSSRDHHSVSESHIHNVVWRESHHDKGDERNTTDEIGLTKLEQTLSNLSVDVASKVPQAHLRNLINIIYHALKNCGIKIPPPSQSDEELVNDMMNEWQRSRNEMKETRFDEFEHRLTKFKDTVLATLHTELSSRDNLIQDSMDNIRQLITLCNDSKSERLEDYSSSQNQLVDNKIKLATESVQNSIKDLISANLEHLALIEEEVAKLTLQLAERPDDTQINKMIHDLDQAISDRVGKTEIFQIILETMKQEMRKIMTKDEVIVLVKSLLNHAKDDIRNNSNSLMVGRVPYRCIGCDRLFAFGVNNTVAAKVNHDALPFCLAPRVSLRKVSTESRRKKIRPQTACNTEIKAGRHGSFVQVTKTEP